MPPVAASLFFSKCAYGRPRQRARSDRGENARLNRAAPSLQERNGEVGASRASGWTLLRRRRSGALLDPRRLVSRKRRLLSDPPLTTATTPTHVAKRGDVVLVLFPHSNLHPARTRLALAVQADNLGTDIPQVIVAMITSRMFRAGHPSRVAVLLCSPEGQHSGSRRVDDPLHGRPQKRSSRKVR
jgi:hypothetical protein